MTAPVDGEDAYNSFAEFFELQRNGNAPNGTSTMHNFIIAIAQYEMRAYLVPDTATNAMNLVLNNLEVARRLGQRYINPGFDYTYLDAMSIRMRQFELNYPEMSICTRGTRFIGNR
jgi:hypothetical protein